MIEAIRKSCIAILAACLLLLVAAAGRAETGVSDTEIRIGMWTPLSGPVALLGQSARDAVRLWAKEVNDRGGVHGRKINFIFYDDAGSPQEAQTVSPSADRPGSGVHADLRLGQRIDFAGPTGHYPREGAIRLLHLIQCQSHEAVLALHIPYLCQ